MRAIFATTAALLALTVCAEPSFAQRFNPMMMRSMHPRPVIQPQQRFPMYTQALDAALAQQVRNSMTPNVIRTQRQIANYQANAVRASYVGYNPALTNSYLYRPTSTYNPYLYRSLAGNPYLYSPYSYNPYSYNPYSYNPYMYNPYMYNPAVYNPYLYNPGVYNPYAYNPYLYTPPVAATAPVLTSPYPY